eukprot:16233-Pyramimonas_sp.AAC.1
MWPTRRRPPTLRASCASRAPSAQPAQGHDPRGQGRDALGQGAWLDPDGQGRAPDAAQPSNRMGALRAPPL